MILQCPCCHYDGEFKPGKVPFFVFSLLDVSRERRRAARAQVCPECGTEIVVSNKARKLSAQKLSV